MNFVLSNRKIRSQEFESASRPKEQAGEACFVGGSIWRDAEIFILDIIDKDLSFMCANRASDAESLFSGTFRSSIRALIGSYLARCSALLFAFSCSSNAFARRLFSKKPRCSFPSPAVAPALPAPPPPTPA